jgi:signal transduction histidine kinase
MMAHPRHWGLRGRITLLVSAVFFLAASVLSIALVLVLRGQMVSQADSANSRRANDIAALLDSDPPSDLPGGTQLPGGAAGADVVQLIGPDGTVQASSSNIAGQPAIESAGDPQSIEGLFVAGRSEPYRVASATQTGQDGRVRTVVVGTPLEGVDSTIDATIEALAIGLPILTVLVAALTYSAVSRSLRPVEAIRTEFSRISSSDLHRRVPIPGTNDEIGALAATLNEILGRLERDVTTQQRFVADAAHELRSPLAALSGQLELDSAARPGDTVTSSALEQSRRLQHLVDNLLLLARYDARRTPPMRLVDLDEVALEEISWLRPTVSVRIDASAVSAAQVRGDRDDLVRLVHNLVDNACRFASTTVTVSLNEIGEHAMLVVSDDGPGVPTEDRQRIFERFARGDEARDRRTGGTGLGLAICAEIVEHHHGSIRVMPSESGGASFTVTLPAAIVPTTDTAEVPRAPDPAPTS